MPERRRGFGPLGAAAGFQESKPPLLHDGAESHRQGLLEVELTQLLFAERQPLFGASVRESDSFAESTGQLTGRTWRRFL